MRIKFNPHTKIEKVWDEKTRCDFCLQDIPRPALYQRADVNLSACVGDSFPEGDNSTTFEIDCCVPCFMERVKPSLEATFGVKFRQRDTEDYTSADYAVEVFDDTGTHQDKGRKQWT